MGIEIQIQYFGSIRAAAKKSEEKTEFAADTTIYRLLQQLVSFYDDDDNFRGEIFDNNREELRDDVTVTLNGTIINHAEAHEIKLNQGDALSLFPIFPGGG